MEQVESMLNTIYSLVLSLKRTDQVTQQSRTSYDHPFKVCPTSRLASAQHKRSEPNSVNYEPKATKLSRRSAYKSKSDEHVPYLLYSPFRPTPQQHGVAYLGIRAGGEEQSNAGKHIALNTGSCSRGNHLPCMRQLPGGQR
jgi:hypothetical protein